MTKTERQLLTSLIRSFNLLVTLLKKIKKGEDIDKAGKDNG